MFFGLFSSHLPFIIVGLVYFASFSVITVQRLISLAEPDSISVENDENKSYFVGNSDYQILYQFPDDQQQAVAIVHQKIPDFPLPEIPLINLKICPIPICDEIAGSLFVRPPPFTA